MRSQTTMLNPNPRTRYAQDLADDPTNTTGRNRLKLTLYLLGVASAATGLLCAVVRLDLTCVLLLLVATVFATALTNFYNIFQMAWMFGHYAFCVMPVLLIYESGMTYSYEVAATCTTFTFLALGLVDKRGTASYQQVLPQGKFIARAYLLGVPIFCGILLVTRGVSFLFLWPLLSLLFTAASAGKGGVTVVIYYLALMSQLLTHLALFWGGFGRLVIGGAILVPTIYVCYCLNLRRAKIPLLLGSMAAALLGTVVRFGEMRASEIAVAALSDSSASPMLTGQGIFDFALSYGGKGVSGSLDQFSLFILGAVPRVLWPNKPNGFGFQYVLDNLDVSFIDAGHSIASSYVGEHFYYLGPWGAVVGIVCAVLAIGWLFNALADEKLVFGSAAYTVALYVPTFYWGGLASFSQRFLLGIVPVLLFFALLNWLQRLRLIAPR